MNKPQFKDAATGKVFAMGSQGSNALAERIREHAHCMHNHGANSAEILPRTLKLGTTFRCSRCNTDFTYGGDDKEEFYNSIRAHGQACTPCEIIPINL